MLEENLGTNWREDYIVWDCACGTKNLTRDYEFKRLYSSTLDTDELTISKDLNLEGTAFQYDFLNDDVDLFDYLKKKKELGLELTEKDFVDSKLYRVAPCLVRGMLKGEPMVFFINPPYGTAGNMRKGTKKGIADTLIAEVMKKNNIGAATQQLFAQFIYRTYTILKLFGMGGGRLALFSSPLFLTGSSYKVFREDMFRYYGYKDGMLLQASNFADVSTSWGISFTIFDTNTSSNSNYIFKVKGIDSDGLVSDEYTKIMYNRKSAQAVKNPPDFMARNGCRSLPHKEGRLLQGY